MSRPTYVLVPGAGGVASFWHLVQRELDARGLESIAVDLPGDDPAEGLPAYVERVVDAATGIGDVVLVAQSLGGFTAGWAADRVPATAIVLLNAMIPLSGETAGEWWEATGSSEARRQHDVSEGRDPDTQVDLDTYFLNDVPPGALAEVAQRDETETVFEAPWDLVSWPGVPTTVLVGRDDRFFPAEFQKRVASERLGLDAVEVPGGHLAALSHPVEVTEAIVSAS